MDSLPVMLMNTVRADRDGERDTIAAPADAARWLRAARPSIGIAGWEPVAELRDLRDALRCLAAAATGDDREPAASPVPDLATAVGIVNRACARAPSWSELTWPDPAWPDPAWPDPAWPDPASPDPALLEPVGPDDRDRAVGPGRVTRSAHAPGLAVVAEIAEAAVALFAGPDRLLLRACPAPGCVLYFVRDHPRREWCSGSCGNRARVARHYRRHHGAGSTEDD